MKGDRTRLYQELAERLRRLRKMMDGAKAVAGVAVEPYSDIEGCRKKCDLNALIELADVYDVTTNFLITATAPD